ncbi:hypothetical protein [Bacillus phage vB_BanS-Thrax3]|nr:hypothetical protein [Bacillus phage vB_BanS-Thrax3]
MEETVYYLCKKDLIMDDGEEAFTKGKFYKMLEKYEDGGVELLNNAKCEHTLTKKYKKKYMIKVKDVSLLKALQEGIVPSDMYLCKKTMRMDDGRLAYKKGRMYECENEHSFAFRSELGGDHYMGDAEFTNKYLVKIGE